MKFEFCDDNDIVCDATSRLALRRPPDGTAMKENDQGEANTHAIKVTSTYSAVATVLVPGG